MSLVPQKSLRLPLFDRGLCRRKVSGTFIEALNAGNWGAISVLGRNWFLTPFNSLARIDRDPFYLPPFQYWRGELSCLSGHEALCFCWR